jgi:hypothetical protein
MPPLAIHTSVARKLAERLRSPTLDGQRGNLYLGATAPDIRVITRWERRRTHFFDLENFDDQHCVATFFEENPSLADAAALEPRTRAFIAGYMSHLVVDAIWIDEIYRPFFGERSPLGGSLRANIMDRALQFSMDSDTRSNPELMAHVVECVARCDLDIEIGFIDRETLGEWHRVISNFVQQEPDWDRFRGRARWHLEATAGGAVSDAEYEHLARSLPDIVDEALRYLGRERVDDVIGESIEASERLVRSYLNCES